MEQVADIETPVLQLKSPKIVGNLITFPPGLAVIQDLFLLQNKAISFVPGNDWTA